MSAPEATRVLFDEPGPRGRRLIRIWAVVVSIAALALLWLAGWVFWYNNQLEPDKWSPFLDRANIAFLGEGLKGTFLALFTAAVVAFPLALVLALARHSRARVPSAIATGWIEFFRSVPMLLVVYFFLLVVPRMSFGGQKVDVPVFWMLVIPMILVSSASTAEVFRAGILAVDRGQREAALSIGMTEGQAMRGVILPQAFRLVLPNLLTALVSLLKDSTLGYVVSYPELMQQGRVLTAFTHNMIQTYLVVAIVYVIVNYLLTQLANWLQGRITRRASANVEEFGEVEQALA